MARRRPSPPVEEVVRNKREAQEALAEAIDSHRRQEFVAPTAIRVRDFFVTWIHSLETQGRKVSTIEGYRKTMSSYVLPTLGSHRLQDLRPTDLDDLYAALLKSGGAGGRPLSMTTVHHVHTQLGKLLHDAERKGLVMRNVARLADAPSLAAARDRAPDMNVWTPDELRRFLEFAEDYRAGPMLHLAAMTGMRRGEVVALRWDSVDLAGLTLKVRAAATFLKGEETIDVPKTKRSRRTIDDRVFTNEIGDPLRPASVGEAFRRLVESVGLAYIRLHELRHTPASHLLAAGVNAEVVSKRLGHSSLSFTLDTYGHVTPGQQSEAAQAAAALLRP